MSRRRGALPWPEIVFPPDSPASSAGRGLVEIPVFCYGADGTYVETFLEEIRRPEGWAVGPVDGLLYVADGEANVIRRYDPDSGSALGVFAEGGDVLAPNSVVFVPR